MDGLSATLLILVFALGALSGILLTWVITARRLGALREQGTRLQAQLEAEQHRREEVAREFQQAREQLSGTFASLAGEALKHNSTEFLKLAQENLKQFHIKAENELARREKAVESLVKPIRETMEKTEQQMRRMEKERQEAYGSLTKHLETMADSNRILQEETRHLVKALRRPEVRGQWGQMTLKRLAELAGMVEHCDFYEQEQVSSEDGIHRPDMVVRMPDGRQIIVDAKTPLDAYLDAVEADDEETRRHALERHARQVRDRVRELSRKGYWQRFAKTPEFVLLFIPGDQFLSAALDKDHRLLEDALANRVVLVTPSSFVAMLRAVAFGWRQESLAENAETIRKLGEELCGRLGTFAEHLSRVGSHLEKSVEAFNKAVGSFDLRVVSSARKFAELGVNTKKAVTRVEQIEQAPRTVETQEDPPPDKKGIPPH